MQKYLKEGNKPTKGCRIKPPKKTNRSLPKSIERFSAFVYNKIATHHQQESENRQSVRWRHYHLQECRYTVPYLYCIQSGAGSGGKFIFEQTHFVWEMNEIFNTAVSNRHKRRMVYRLLLERKNKQQAIESAIETIRYCGYCLIGNYPRRSFLFCIGTRGLSRFRASARAEVRRNEFKFSLSTAETAHLISAVFIFRAVPQVPFAVPRYMYKLSHGTIGFLQNPPWMHR